MMANLCLQFLCSLLDCDVVAKELEDFKEVAEMWQKTFAIAAVDEVQSFHVFGYDFCFHPSTSNQSRQNLTMEFWKISASKSQRMCEISSDVYVQIKFGASIQVHISILKLVKKHFQEKKENLSTALIILCLTAKENTLL